MSKGEPKCLSRLPRDGVAMSDLTLEEIVGLQGFTLEDLAENRRGKLSAAQKVRLLEGHRDLFGLVHVRVAAKELIEQGLIASQDGLPQACEGSSINGAALKLTLDDKMFLWVDEETYRAAPHSTSAAVLAMRLQLLQHWVDQRQRLRVYYLEENLISVEPLNT